MLSLKMGKFMKIRVLLCQQRVRIFFCVLNNAMLIREIFHLATEDTDKVESEQTEVRTKAFFCKIDEWVWPLALPLFLYAQRKTLGEPTDVVDGPNALEFNRNAIDSVSSPHELQTTKYVMAARDDGLVREEKENRVVSREDTTELTEVEDVKHYGDFSDAVSLLKTYFRDQRIVERFGWVNNRKEANKRP